LLLEIALTRRKIDAMKTRGFPAALGYALIYVALSKAGGQQTPVDALHHAAWTVRDGAPSGITSLAQSADGVLWLGTSTGLYRFDGVHFDPIDATLSKAFPSLVIGEVLALPDTTLWIGYLRGGVSVLSHGRVVSYDSRHGLPAGTISSLARDSTGGIWAASTTGLARFHGGRWERMGAEQGFPGGMTTGMTVDRRGVLWVSNQSGVFALARGATRFLQQAPSLDPDATGTGMLREAPDGSVWATSAKLGLTRVSDSAGRAVPLRAAAERVRDALGLTIDRHSNAWMDSPLGYFRIRLKPVESHAGPAERLLPLEAISLTTGAPSTLTLLDREGNTWIGTGGGLERFREPKLHRATLSDAKLAPAVAPAVGGGIWTVLASHPPSLSGVVVAAPAELHDISCVHRDLIGDVWFGGPTGMWRTSPAASPASVRFTRVALPEEPGPGDVQAIARTLDGDLWVSMRGRRMTGVFRRRGDTWSLAPLPSTFLNQVALTVVADSSGQVWLGYAGNRLVRIRGDSVRVYSASEGIRIGAVTALLVRRDHLWLGGERGVMRLRGEMLSAVSSTEKLEGVTGIVETGNGDLWLNGAGGVTHVAAAGIERALRDSSYSAPAERFDHHDGLGGQAPQVRPLPTAIEGTDGRLWFTSETGAVWIDPRNISRNSLAPPVQVRALRVAGKDYGVENHVELPVRTTQLDIAYTALSLAIPDRVRFRYRLSGVDTAWRDAGTRREAYYTNLSPGSYRFQVVAANEDGVWNEAGAGVSFEIPPTFTQTRAFLALLGILIVGALVSLASWRQRHLARALRAQFRGQLVERARVARELHDSVLGDLAGVALQLRAGAQRVAATDASNPVVVELFTRLSTDVQHAIGEVRRSVNAMRAQLHDESTPVHLQLAALAQRSFSEPGISARVVHSGLPRSFPPAVEAEILFIATEAMMNARKHSGCGTLNVTCAYEPRELRVSVADDGRGFDTAAGTPAGHWGLVGMRERAASIGASLLVSSNPGNGTEVLLVVAESSRRRGSLATNTIV
jgi:signal transduction histidine kinase/ligand-binding sensor domain-containing protein